jgi:hypothetical protein
MDKSKRVEEILDILAQVILDYIKEDKVSKNK